MKIHSNGDNPGFPSVALDLLRDEALSHFGGVPETQRDVRTALPYLSFIRFTRPTELTRGILEPSMCLVLQGKKKVLIGSEISHYGRGSYVLSAIDMPVSGQVSDASLAEPYLGVRIALDAREIAAQIIEHKLAVPKNSQPRAAAYVEAADAELQDAFLRLARLLKKPRDLAVLAPLVKQEILFRLISARNGGLLAQTVLAHDQEKGVNQAIHWIKTNYAEPMHIEKLAKTVSMSVSNLHHRFKAITVMSPLQYQKQVRLLEARKLLLGGSIEAATVAFKVGYESPSQFSREYRRLFGASPLQDMEYLKHHELDQ
ncbi:AraC family transcriptional regulator [Collimonas humicola]|uniref:AraC family transcriptional regulator n=1 Tax=Collimonas humicola TaxID=2825886 RepID=UPI001B8C6978|nr:AraC family transcriptional regulator [Collimonas humicola]